MLSSVKGGRIETIHYIPRLQGHLCAVVAASTPQTPVGLAHWMKWWWEMVPWIWEWEFLRRGGRTQAGAGVERSYCVMFMLRCQCQIWPPQEWPPSQDWVSVRSSAFYAEHTFSPTHLYPYHSPPPHLFTTSHIHTLTPSACKLPSSLYLNAYICEIFFFFLRECWGMISEKKQTWYLKYVQHK